MQMHPLYVVLPSFWRGKPCTKASKPFPSLLWAIRLKAGSSVLRQADSSAGVRCVWTDLVSGGVTMKRLTGSLTVDSLHSFSSWPEFSRPCPARPFPCLTFSMDSLYSGYKGNGGFDACSEVYNKASLIWGHKQKQCFRPLCWIWSVCALFEEFFDCILGPNARVNTPGQFLARLTIIVGATHWLDNCLPYFVLSKLFQKRT